MLLSLGLSISYVVCGLLQYVQVLKSLVYSLEHNRFTKNQNFFLKLPEPTPLTPRKQISFNTFRNNNNSFTLKPKRTKKRDIESQTDTKEREGTRLSEEENLLAFTLPEINSDSLYVTPVPLVSLVMFAFTAYKLYQDVSVSPEERVQRLQKISLHAGFCICFLSEVLERKRCLPSRATAASLSFALLNEIILLWSHSSEELVDSVRVFQFQLISLIVLFCLAVVFVFKASMSLRIAISFVSCIHGGIFLMPKYKATSDDSLSTDNILLVHFQLSQLLFLFFIVFVGLYSIAFKVAREEIKIINFKFQKLTRPLSYSVAPR